jgi:hypothetical protein
LPPWDSIFNSVILKKEGRKFSEVLETIFWNEVIKARMRHNRKPSKIFSSAILPQASSFYSILWSTNEKSKADKKFRFGE